MPPTPNILKMFYTKANVWLNYVYAIFLKIYSYKPCSQAEWYKNYPKWCLKKYFRNLQDFTGLEGYFVAKPVTE